MNNQKKELAFPDIIQAVGLLVLAISVFAGILFYSEGNLVISISASVILNGGLYGLAYVLHRLKTSDKNQSAAVKFEIFMWLAYLLLAIPALVCHLHFTNIEFNKKKELQLALNNKLDAIPGMFTDYKNYVKDRAKDYERELETIIGFRKRQEADKYGLEPDGSNLSALVDVLKDILKPGGKFDALEEEAGKFTRRGKGTVNAWDRLNLPLLMVEIDEKWVHYQTELIALSEGGKDGGELFQPEVISSSATDALSRIDKLNWSALPVLGFLVLQLLILWPYLFTERMNRGKIMKTIDTDTNTM